MTTTAINTLSRPREGARHAEEGPVVLAAKPFDGSEAPVAVARWLAQREDRELHVVSVLEKSDALAIAAGVPPLPPQYYEEERSAIAERVLADVAGASKDYVTARVDVIDGPSAQTIVDVAHDRGARVIVIGTGRHDSLGRFVYGERAMQIVRISDRPVLIVPRAASAGFVRHALVAVDFSPASLRAAAAALPMLSQGSRLTLVHTKPAAKSDGDLPSNVAEGRCAELFERFLALLPTPPGIEVDTRVLWGEPVVAIDEFARRNGVSLIACGRRQNYTLAERLFVGSVSAGLLRRVNCPILIVPELKDDAAEAVSVALTGVESWLREEWPEQLEAFSLRNRGHLVRLSIEAEGMRSGRCVAQDYVLRTVAYDRGEERLTVMLGDSAPAPNVLQLLVADITAFTLFTDIAGNDTRLSFDNANGRGTLTVATAELP